jgi:hypothetical protein
MKLKLSTKSYDILIYALIIVLLLIVFYDFYNVVNKTKKNTIPHNSISVSPITGEKMAEVSSKNSIIGVKYSPVKIKNLTNISISDIVYETFNKNSNHIEYWAIFYNKKIERTDSIDVIKNMSLNEIPHFNFIDKLDLEKFNFKSNYDTIFIEYTPEISSSFTYNGEDYVHYNGPVVEKNVVTNKELSFKNIIIQYVNEDKINHEDVFSHKGDGYGFLFTGGKAQKIFWRDNKFYLSDGTTPLSLIRGNTYWVVTDQSTNIITSKYLVKN